MAKPIDIVVPELGDFSDVEVIELLVGPGDTVATEDGLITLETDKAAMDVPAPESGSIEQLSVKVGDTVNSGDVIGTMIPLGDAPEEAAVEEPAGEPAREPAVAVSSSDESAPPAAAVRSLDVPELGDFADVEVIEVHVKPGDEVEVDDPLVTLETDKAAMDVPAEAAGVIESVSVAVGDKVSKGTPLAMLATAGDVAPRAPAPEKPDDRGTPAVETPEAAPAAAAPPRPDRPATTGTLPPVNEAGFARAHASPSVRKLARELGVDLVSVKGSGPKGRVLHDDVKAFVKSILSGAVPAPGAGGLPKTPVVDFAKFGEIEHEPLTRIQKIAGPRLQASWVNLPHVTQHDLADITGLEERRNELKGPARERGIRLTPLAFVLKACVSALKAFPKVNASLAEDGENLVLKRYVHLGFAADTDQGLVVPVIRDADQKDVYEIAAELGELSALAREGKLKAPQLQGATFTISSLGGIGGTAFTPIVNAPEVAILGVSRSSMQPVWDGEAFQPRLMLPLSFSYDHRVIDGAMAVRFTTYLGEALADVDKLLEAIP